MTNITTEKKNFRTLVLEIKKVNPTWSPKKISEFLLSSENPPDLSPT